MSKHFWVLPGCTQKTVFLVTRLISERYITWLLFSWTLLPLLESGKWIWQPVSCMTRLMLLPPLPMTCEWSVWDTSIFNVALLLWKEDGKHFHLLKLILFINDFYDIITFLVSLLLRPSFFNFLIYEKIFKILELGGQNKNKIPKIVQSIKK